MLWIGIVLLLAGGGCFWMAVRTQRRVHAMMAAETLAVPELLERARITADLGGGPGGFRLVCEVVGETAPAPVGILRSELAGVECVWHAHRVERRFERRERDDEGRMRTSTHTETVSERTSPHGWPLVRDGHSIGVDPGGVRPDPVEQVLDRFEPGAGPSGGVGDSGFLGGHRDRTVGYRHQEWVLRPGVRMYVLGEVDDRDGPLVIRRPQDRAHPFVLSTRTEEELTTAARAGQRWWARGGAAAVLLGLVLAVAGAVT
ncbi:E3 Ubiquitin ligase [Pseudonocardia ammonioxydans]|uniref:RING-type E3 ubiquitin transferase n=1 Tax=Pseudonocardia ammonioxydans TaxID=260086 RepID=A0A1I4W2M6_PSUAM|nr:E3 ubiquitin ligase family protein [Pseudonocardia ammonioxydans]SFN07640.1 E3 Ubiquitin ligase [Pseudonocardia ammonioxydans]